MKLRRHAEPTFDPQFAPLIVALFFAYEEGLACCHEVAAADGQIDDELRRRALVRACRIAEIGRVVWEAMLNLDLLNRIPPEQNPVRALAASARLAYSLTASAEDDPEPETILTVGELDGLPVLYELRDWLACFDEPVADTGDEP